MIFQNCFNFGLYRKYPFKHVNDAFYLKSFVNGFNSKLFFLNAPMCKLLHNVQIKLWFLPCLMFLLVSSGIYLILSTARWYHLFIKITNVFSHTSTLHGTFLKYLFCCGLFNSNKHTFFNMLLHSRCHVSCLRDQSITLFLFWGNIIFYSNPKQMWYIIHLSVNLGKSLLITFLNV